MLTSQEKNYQKIESLFSSPSLGTETSLEEKERETDEEEVADEEEVEKGEHPVSIKKSIEIECQGKKYAYHLGEVLRRKWNVWDVLHGSEKDEKEKDEKEEEEGDIQKGGSRLFFGGGGVEEEPNDSDTEDMPFQLRFCVFNINNQAIVPFLSFWLVPGKEGVLGFPETSFVPSSDKSMDTEEEEEHAEFLDVCRKKFLEMGIFQDNAEEAFTTERMEQNYHGYIVSPDEKKVVYVFYQLSPPLGVPGKWGILDEILNQGKVLGTPVDKRIQSLFYANNELLYIYGSPVNPIDALFYGADSNYDTTNETEQEIPYCLYLCEDKTEFSEEFQEGKAVETPAGKLLGLEEAHYLSPKDKYQLSKKENKSMLRTEDEYGYFYYFTNELLQDKKEEVKRYAVFVYNTDYRLDKSTLNILKSLDMEKRLVGGEHWKMDFSLDKWIGGGLLDFLTTRPSPSSEEEGAVEDSDEREEEPPEKEEEEEEAQYASVYFQRDGIPLWCIKNSICFTVVE